MKKIQKRKRILIRILKPFFKRAIRTISYEYVVVVYRRSQVAGSAVSSQSFVFNISKK